MVIFHSYVNFYQRVRKQHCFPSAFPDKNPAPAVSYARGGAGGAGGPPGSSWGSSPDLCETRGETLVIQTGLING